jgi:hypothetical protein
MRILKKYSLHVLKFAFSGHPLPISGIILHGFIHLISDIRGCPEKAKFQNIIG